LVLPILEKKYPKDDRPRKAIEAAKNWLANPTKENAHAADAHAAHAADAAHAAVDAAASYTADAAYAATYRKIIASAAAYAAVYDAAYDAAYDAYDAAVASAAYAATYRKIIKYGINLLREVNHED